MPKDQKVTLDEVVEVIVGRASYRFSTCRAPACRAPASLRAYSIT